MKLRRCYGGAEAEHLSLLFALRYEQLVTLYPDNQEYKLYYAQSLYKVGCVGFRVSRASWACWRMHTHNSHVTLLRPAGGHVPRGQQGSCEGGGPPKGSDYAAGGECLRAGRPRRSVTLCVCTSGA